MDLVGEWTDPSLCQCNIVRLYNQKGLVGLVAILDQLGKD